MVFTLFDCVAGVKSANIIYMNWRSFTSRILPISALLLVVMFKFQNCAPSNNTSTQTSANGTVGIVDNFSQTPLEFVANPQLIESTATYPLQVQGLCVGGDDSQVINYQVYNMNGTPSQVSSGQASCVMGGFELSIATKLAFNSCSDRYEVHATRSGQESTPIVTTLQLDCTSSSSSSSTN
jgi:hypothetical protein